MQENDNKNTRFRRGDERLIVALASGASIRKAAKVCRVSQATVARRLRDPDFRREMNDVRARMVNTAIGRLAASMVAATATLRKLLKATSETVALGAARAIVEMHCRLKESAELEQRIAALEEQQSGRPADGQRGAA